MECFEEGLPPHPYKDALFAYVTVAVHLLSFTLHSVRATPSKIPKRALLGSIPSLVIFSVLTFVAGIHASSFSLAVD